MTHPRLAPAATRLIVRYTALLAVLAAVTSGCGAKDAQGKSATVGSGTAYVALGDSYTAGPGIPPVVNPRCGRSALNYPSLVAKALKVKEFADRSCTASTTLDLDTPQSVRWGRINDPQLNVVNHKTTLVTIGQGLNNEEISTELLLVCLTRAGSGPMPGCTRFLAASTAAINAQIDLAASQVQKAIEHIETLAPRARIVLIGYPRYFPDSGDCPGRVPMVSQAVPKVVNALKAINDDWKRAAASAGADYVDTWTMSKGHDVCSDDPWVNGATAAPGKAAALHPFESFHRAAAAAVVQLVQTPAGS